MKKCLVVHVPYQVRGGEDVAVESQTSVLAKLGYHVSLWPENRKPPELALSAAIEGLVPFNEWAELETRLEKLGPEFVVLNHVYPLFGPRLLRVLTKLKIPMFWVIHNHRLYCANGLAMRNGKVCRDCKSKKPWRAVSHNCNGDLAKSVYYSLALNQLRLSDIDAFVAPSPYMGAEIESLGVSPEKVRWIVNPIQLENSVSTMTGEKVDVFFGSRLSPEKGIETLLKAIERVPQIQFVIAGDGALKSMVENAALRLKNLRYVGMQSRAGVMDWLRCSKISVLPSQCNETLPTSALESFTLGKRCVIPDMESTRWLAEKPFLGVLANTFDPVSIAESIQKTLALSPPTEAEVEYIRWFFGFERYKTGWSEFLSSRGIHAN